MFVPKCLTLKCKNEEILAEVLCQSVPEHHVQLSSAAMPRNLRAAVLSNPTLSFVAP